jgi:hypothetical protein
MTTQQEQMSNLMMMMQEMARAMTIQAQTAAAARVPTGSLDQDRPPSSKRIICSKSFNRLAKFSKGEDNWKEYNFEFGVILGSESPDMLETLKVLESMASEVDTGMVRALDEGRADRMNLEKMSKELYEVLVITTEGEARLMVRNIISQDGIQAWHRLYRHYNRRTFARVLRVHKEAMHPKPAKDLSMLISHIVEWEDRWNRMAKEHKDPLPVIWKMAALMELCPMEVQDMIYQNVDEVNEDYDKLKQKIITWASNKVASDGVPMDIGRVENEDYEEYEVGAVGWNSQCYNCSGYGHLSRDCPSEKKGKGNMKGDGKGKGITYGKGGGNTYGKGGGKDVGKGGGKDSGKGGKSMGKGYQGTCFNCGKLGHKAWECRGGRQVGAVDEEDDEYEEVRAVQAGSVEIGTVWNIGGVECCVDKVEPMMVDEAPKTKKIEITVDSGAGASCWPSRLLKKVPMMAKDKGVRFRAANGTELKYYGTKNIQFQATGGEGICDMRFHVTDTTKPLASAAAIVKMGNRVILEDGPGKAYIEHIASGRRIPLRESGGTFLLDADCFAEVVFSGRG